MKTGNILVVDSDFESIKAAKQQLPSRYPSQELLIAKSLAEALEYLTFRRFNAVLSRMSIRNGGDMNEKIAQGIQAGEISMLPVHQNRNSREPKTLIGWPVLIAALMNEVRHIAIIGEPSDSEEVKDVKKLQEALETRQKDQTCPSLCMATADSLYFEMRKSKMKIPEKESDPYISSPAASYYTTALSLTQSFYHILPNPEPAVNFIPNWKLLLDTLREPAPGSQNAASPDMAKPSAFN